MSVWNRSEGKAGDLVERGVTEITSVHDAWAADVCITMLDPSREPSHGFVRLRFLAAPTECYYISIPQSRLWSLLRLLCRSRAVVITPEKLCASACQLW